MSLDDQLFFQKQKCQKQEIEIERLQTTCRVLNTRATLTEDLKAELEMVSRRLADAESIAAIREEECRLLEEEKQRQDQRLQDQIVANEDLIEQTKELKRDLNMVIENKQVMQKELVQANQYVLTMEEKVYKSNKISLELLRRLKDAEVELDTLKQYCRELKVTMPAYKHVKDDEIDRRLADYVNSHTNMQKLRIMFTRNSEGVYTFGSRKVKMFLENNKLRVRVGGGFLSIDEFLDHYHSIEYDKMEHRDDPVRRMKEKLRAMNSHRSFTITSGQKRANRSVQRSMTDSERLDISAGYEKRVKFDNDTWKHKQVEDEHQEIEKKAIETSGAVNEAKDQKTSGEAIKLNK